MLPGLFIPPGSAYARDISVEYQGGTNATVGSTADYTDAPIGTADSTRLVVAMLFSRDSNTIYTANSATIGGISATIIQSSSASNTVKACIIYAFVPTGTTATISVSFSEAIGNVFHFEVYTITGLTPGSLAVNSNTNATGAGTSLATTVNVPLVPSVTIGAFVGQDYTKSLTWTGLDEEIDAAASIYVRVGVAVTIESSVNAAKAVSCAHSGGSVDLGLAVANFS